MELMRKYLWPGNVRELKNVVERAVVLCRGEFIEHEDLMLSKLSTAGDTGECSAAPSQFRPASLDDIERQHILATLVATNWNKSQTAALLGIERSTLDRKIRRYELVEEQPQGGPLISRPRLVARAAVRSGPRRPTPLELVAQVRHARIASSRCFLHCERGSWKHCGQPSSDAPAAATMGTGWTRFGSICPACSWSAVADDNKMGLAAAAKKLKVDKAFTDYRQMLDAGEARRGQHRHRAGSTSIATWSWRRPIAEFTSIWKNRSAARWPKPTRWSPPANARTPSWPSPTPTRYSPRIPVVKR